MAIEAGFAPGPDFVILAEDDILVSTDVIEYFTWAVDPTGTTRGPAVTTYQHASSPRPPGKPADWSRDSHFTCWVWGTWRDRWETLLRDSWDTSYAENGGGPLQRGWDWGFRNRLIIGGGMAMIAPSLARSQHIGRYGGTHCSPADFDVVASRCFAGLDVPPQDYQEVAPCPAR